MSGAITRAMAARNDTLAQFDSVIQNAMGVLTEQTIGLEDTIGSLCTHIVDALEKKIVKEDGEYCVKGKSGKNFGCYSTKVKAQARLDQIESFSKALTAASVSYPGDEASVPEDKSTLDAVRKLEQTLCMLGARLDDAAIQKSMSAGVLHTLSEEVRNFLKDSKDVDKAAHKGKGKGKSKEKDKDEDEDDSKLPPFLRGKKTKTKKGLPAGAAEAGIHIHGTERENSTTKRDAPHDHVFMLEKDIDFGADIGILPEGMILWSDTDGSHTHDLAAPNANRTEKGGEHFHSVWLPGGDVAETSEDGEHAHELQVISTAFDGMHTHSLELPDGSTISSMLPGDFWEKVMGSPRQDWRPLIPQASMFAALPDYVWQAMDALASIPVAALKNDAASLAEKSGYKAGEMQALKVPDPAAIMKRLIAGDSAGLLSMAKRQSRVGTPQLLVNELAALKFDDSFIWGVVKHHECKEFKDFDAIPEELLEGIDDHSRAEFAKSVGTVFYLPFELMKAFDHPIKLIKPPGGRRFAAKVDLAKDVTPVTTCVRCRTTFEKAKSGVHVCEACLVVSLQKGVTNPRKVRIVKAEENGEERTTFGVVLVPDETDAQEDRYTKLEVQKAAYGYMEENAGVMKVMHKGEVRTGDLVVLETYLSKSEQTFGDDTFPEGTWFMTTRVVDDDLWDAVKDGTFTGYSIGGSAIREPLS